MDTVDTEPDLVALTQRVVGRIADPGSSATVEVNVLMASGSGTTAIWEELVETLWRQRG